MEEPLGYKHWDDHIGKLGSDMMKRLAEHCLDMNMFNTRLSYVSLLLIEDLWRDRLSTGINGAIGLIV